MNCLINVVKGCKFSPHYFIFLSSFFIIFFLFISTPSFAGSDARIQLTQYLQAMTTYSAQFKQTVYDKQHAATQILLGEMAWQKPNLFRWNIQSNPKQKVILKKDTLWIYDPDLEQVIIRAWRQIEDQVAPVLILNAPTKTLMQYFNVTQSSNRDHVEIFNLTPKNQDALFKLIQLGFKRGELIYMILHDALSGTTMIEFSHVQINRELSPQLFILKYPSSTDVIDERKKI